MRPARLIVLAIVLALIAGGLWAGEPPLATARQALLQGRYDHAIELLDKVGPDAPKPDRLDAGSLRFRVLMETGRYAEANAEADRLAKLAPNEPDVLALAAEVLLETGRYDEAAAKLAAALARNPSHLRSRMLAVALARLTGDTKAEETHVGFFFDLYNLNKAKTAEELTAVAVAVAEEDPHGAWRAYQEAQQADPKFLDAYVLAGFHCLGKYAWALARQNFQNALKLNPNLAAAHAGLAAVEVANSRYRLALKAIEAALKVNPNLRTAHLLKAAVYGAEEKYAESLAEIQKALSVNPNDPRALAMLAAHYELTGQPKKRDATIARVLAINPHYAELYATLARASERLRRCPAAIAWAKKAIELDPGHWEGYFLAGVNYLRSGEERQGYGLLERAFQLNRFNVWAYNMLSVLDRDFKAHEFRYHQTEHFFVKLHKSEDAILWPYLEAILEPLYERLTRRYGFRPKGPSECGGKVLVSLFPTHEQFSARTIGLPGLGAEGACLGQVITMPSPSRRRPTNWKLVLTHEFAHVVTLQKTNYNIPRWLTEGLSVWEERDDRLRWDPLLVRAVERKMLLPLDALNSGFTRPKTRIQVPLSYYQGLLTVRHVVQNYGMDALLKMLDLYAQGKKTREVVPAVIGKPLADFDREVMAYIERFARGIGLDLPPDPEELKKLEAQLKKKPSNPALLAKAAWGRLGARRLGEARKAAEEALKHDPRSALAHYVLGLLALREKRDVAKAKAEFQAAAEAAPRWFRPRLRLAVIAEQEGDRQKAIAFFEEVRRLYPRLVHGQGNPYLHLARLYRESGNSKKAMEVLRHLATLAPASLAARLQLAELLAEDGRHSEAAEQLLEAIYINPFDPGIHLARARECEKAGSLETAVGEYVVAARLDPRGVSVLASRARALAVAGRAKAARLLLKAIRTVAPQSPEIPAIEKLLQD